MSVGSHARHPVGDGVLARLNAALADTGFSADRKSDAYDDATRKAVEALYDKAGYGSDGSVPAGEVVLAVPVTAIVANGSGGTEVVVVEKGATSVTDANPRRVPVAVGVTGGGWAQITPVNDDLAAGDLALGPPPRPLRAPRAKREHTSRPEALLDALAAYAS